MTQAGTGPAVVFVQPALAMYRVPFYEALAQLLSERGLTLRILVGRTDEERTARGDLVELAWSSNVPTVQLLKRPVRLSYKRVSLEAATLLILEHGSSILENYRILSARHRPAVALWGHGGAYVSRGGRVDAALERWQLQRADHYFAYTDAGGLAVRASGMPAERVTVVRNSVDVTTLTRARLAAVYSGSSVRRELGLGDGPVGLFVGGLDDSKRLPFLIEAASRVRAKVPSFNLVIAGDGPQRDIVERAAAASDGAIRYTGRLSHEQVGKISNIASIIMMPGRVGLIAVDSFAIGVPVATTEWPYHAPEFGYLRPGVDCLVTPDDIVAYSDQVASLLLEPDRLEAMAANASCRAAEFSTEAMARAFAGGIETALSRRPRGVEGK